MSSHVIGRYRRPDGSLMRCEVDGGERRGGGGRPERGGEAGAARGTEPQEEELKSLTDRDGDDGKETPSF